MPKTMEGFKVGNFPKGFEKILESWFAVIRDYNAKAGEDAIYWYNERANVGAFAAAMARNEIPVIEEYACEKGRGKERGPGRSDISFYYHGTWYIAEAKMHWSNLSFKTRPLDAKKYMESALADVKKTAQQDKYSTPFGLAFIIPRIKTADKEHVDEFLRNYISQLENSGYCDFWAYCAPAQCRYLTPVPPDYFYPMAIVLGKKLG
ncbi:MAG: hypothetical protein LBT97_07645 [Planctomycetota bacterium]|jgi:hypothetical protein|nr:hypothetical protein [Planctomycetota bacterium]